MTKQQHSHFEDQVRQVLDSSLDDLDAETLSKLSYLKYRASKGAAKQYRKRWWALAPAVVTLLIVVLLNAPSGDRRSVPLELTELNILTDTTPLEFYAQDIEFYLWLSDTMEKDSALHDLGSVLPGYADTIATVRSGRAAG